MGYLNEENMVHLAGKVLSEPVFSHKTCGEAFYLTVMGILRRSGYEDRIRVIIPEKLMEERMPQPDELMELCGQVRTYNKSDYIPTIAWGRNAVYGGSLEVGDKVALEGRIQSREYRKFTDEGEAVTKIAYEVSASRLELMEE